MFISNSTKHKLYNVIRNKCYTDLNAKECVDNVIKLCEERSLDFEKVTNELTSVINTTAEIRNMSAFVNAVVSKLDVAVFRLRPTNVSFLSLHEALRSFGFKGEWWELFLIDEIEKYAIDKYHIDIETFIKTNRAIVVYCVQNDYLTYKEFKDFLLRSKILKGKEFPFKELEENACKLDKEYEEMLNGLDEEKGEDLYGKN